MVSGCNGCRNDSQKTAQEQADEEKKNKEKEKPNFETNDPVIFPGNYENGIANNFTKFGHWVTADFQIIANKFNSQGELTAYCVDGSSRPVPIPNTNYFALSARPVSMPKEEWRHFETNVFLPRRKFQSTFIDFAINRGSGGVSQIALQHISKVMQAHQYHFVVLTNRPEAYNYVQLLDAVQIPNVDVLSNSYPPFYYVVRTNPRKFPIPLPRQPLNWTTIAYLLWDDLDADQLDEQQQQAMLDWIHFGGQLILSGPDCLDKLGNSFLADYLPATFDGAQNLTSQDFEEINEFWSVPLRNQPDLARKIIVTDKAPLLGIKFKPHPDSNFVYQSGKIAIERQIGRGRIVATSFSMDDAPVVAWPSYQNFFNGCLLRRPGRKFMSTDNENVPFRWADDDTSIYDPLIGSTLRFISRDLVNSSATGRPNGTPVDPNVNWVNRSDDMDGLVTTGQAAADRRNLDDHWHYGGFQHDVQSGTAGWNDNSGVSSSARETLKEAAGITPPSSRFVLQMLAAYLIVLVPVNWIVFRSIGKIEWAWIAAPLIAIAGAFTVARMASLDIGFVRSNSQVAFLEIFGDYPRAHLSQFSALYTSLSTGYDLDLDNASGQSLPLGEGRLGKFSPRETIQPVTLRRTLTSRLEDFQVQSNTTGMVHTEFMFDLGGTFSLTGTGNTTSVENTTVIGIANACLLRRTADGDCQFAWIGDLPAGSGSDPLNFESMTDPRQMREPWLQRKVILSAPYIAHSYWTGELGQKPFSEDRNQSVSVSELKNIPEFNARWDEFLAIIGRRLPGVDFSLLEETAIDFPSFLDAYESFNQRADIDVSRLFDSVIDNLDLAAGETRLIGVTRENIGNTKISPASTQTQQQTLVLVHLRRPPLPQPTSDVNSLIDFTGKSSLDWEQDMKALESEPQDSDE